MTDQRGGYGGERRDEIAYVCAEFQGLHAGLEAHSTEGAAPLERLLAALRAGADPTAPLEALHEALLAAGDAAGIHGQTRGLHPIGVGAATPDEWVLLCPTGQCSRHAWPDDPEAPHCRIGDLPLRREPL